MGAPTAAGIQTAMGSGDACPVSKIRFYSVFAKYCAVHLSADSSEIFSGWILFPVERANPDRIPDVLFGYAGRGLSSRLFKAASIDWRSPRKHADSICYACIHKMSDFYSGTADF